MLSAHGIEVERGGSALLRNVDFHVAPGETVALIGPNGAGKSTLLHVLSGAIAAGRGGVRLDGVPLAERSPAALACRRAVLPQTPELGFPLSVHEVVALGRSPHSGLGDRGRDREAVSGALEECEVAHLAERPWTHLSGGERQRVQLARVLAQVWSSEADGDAPVRYLLLDEPTNNLDLAHQQRIVATASRFARRGNGVVAVLHDPNLAAQYADRIIVLVQGRVLADGLPHQIISEDVMRSAFGVEMLCRTHPVNGRPYMVPA
jgi:iron complex transport system ATP-binding protein